MSIRDKTTSQITDIFDVDESTIKRWVSAGCPCDSPPGRGKPRKFNEAEVAAWMQATNRSGKPGRPQEAGSDDLKALKIRKELALVLKYERENAIDEGKLIDATAEQNRDVAKIATIRNKLSSLGATLSPQLEGLDGAERQTLIDKSIEQILLEFSRE